MSNQPRKPTITARVPVKTLLRDSFRNATDNQLSEQTDLLKQPEERLEEAKIAVTIPVKTIMPVKFRRAEDHLILVASHAFWKEKICNAITNKETLDVKDIFKADSCDLGYWLLHGEVHPHISHLQTYHDLMKRNAEFHIQASKVAEHINAKRYDAALRLTECTSAFESSSKAVVAAILILKRDFDRVNKRANGTLKK